jgi:hypothetical protein
MGRSISWVDVGSFDMRFGVFVGVMVLAVRLPSHRKRCHLSSAPAAADLKPFACGWYVLGNSGGRAMHPNELGMSSEECVRRGKEIYERVVKPKLTKEDDRKFVSVDVLSEDYELDHDGIAASDRLRLRRPQGVFWGGRVGQPAAYRMGWSSFGFREPPA